MKALIKATLFWLCPNCGDKWPMDKIRGKITDAPECEACGDTAQFTISFESVEELKTPISDTEEVRTIYYKGKKQ